MSVNYAVLGKRIGYFRMQCGNITQEALASKINRSREFLAKIEKATEHSSVATLVNIADALCISVDDLLIDSSPRSSLSFIISSTALHTSITSAPSGISSGVFVTALITLAAFASISIAISVKTIKLTARGLAYVLGMVGRKIRKAYRGRQVPHGKQSVRKLMAQGTATNSIELSGDAKSFDRVALKWNVDYFRFGEWQDAGNLSADQSGPHLRCYAFQPRAWRH